MARVEIPSPIHKWTALKLEYLDYYLQAYVRAAKRAREIHCTDAFAGCGDCVIIENGWRVEGSPLIALQCEVPFTHYFFNDINADSIASLKDRTSTFTSPKVNYFNRDCNEVIECLLPKLPSSSLDFCFIDPTNWQIKFDSIQRLTKDRRIDIAITFHTGAIKRCADDAPQELDGFFGDPAWREEYKSMLLSGKREGSRVLLDAYENRLRDLGYKDIQDRVLVRTPRNLPLYHLIFASKDQRGKDFWNKISQKSSSGQLRLPEEAT